MYSLRTSAQCLALALCALVAGAASNAAFAQAGGSMGMSDTTHKMSGTKDGASKDKMGAKDKGMKGSDAMKSHEMMDSKEKGGEAMGNGMMKSDSGKMGDGMGMKGESKGKKSKKPKDSMSKDTTMKKP